MDSESAFRYLQELAELLVKEDGSDMFITADSAPALKLKGELRRVGHDPLSGEQTEVLVRSIMSDQVARQFDESNEANFALQMEQLARFRVSAFRQRGTSAMVLRRIRSSIPDFAALHLPPLLAGLSLEPRGLILFVGGTGSGKSTSLGSMIDYRNANKAGHIITIEDPIEYFHSHKRSLVEQREVGTDTESYTIALKNSLRQAPDALLIGEIRDRDNMELAIVFSETGHLVLSTLHADNTDRAFDRILNFFPVEKRDQILMDLSFNLRAIISQRLVQRSDAEGMVPALEILLTTPLISEMIFQNRLREIKEAISRSTESGLITFDQSLFQLYEDGKIDYETALRNADSVNNLRLQIKLRSQRPPPEGSQDSAAGISLQQDGGSQA